MVGPPEHVCPGCGSVLDHVAEALAARDETIRDQAIQLAYLRGEVRKARALPTEETDAFATDARRVFEYWRARLRPRAREFTGERFDKVAARLRGGATVEELCRAIDGAARYPYVTANGRSGTGTKRERFDELSLICRSEEKVHQFIRFAEHEEPVTPAPAESNGHRTVKTPPEHLAAWRAALDDPAVLARLNELRGWSPAVVTSLGLGLDAGRIVFPVRDATGQLVGLHRYQPNPDLRSAPKMLAEGTRELFPRPEDVDATSCWLVEGEPDAVAMLSADLPAVGVPGVSTWKRGWDDRFARFERVYICFDCDDEGRRAAQRRLSGIGRVTHAVVVDLDPRRSDGYDATALLLERGDGAAAELVRRAVPTGGSIAPLTVRSDPYDDFVRALEEHDCRVRRSADGYVAQCPCHDDRVPSLSINRGDDGRVLLHCHAGCAPVEVVAAVGWEMRHLFAREVG